MIGRFLFTFKKYRRLILIKPSRLIVKLDNVIGGRAVKIERIWAIPNKWTFTILHGGSKNDTICTIETKVSNVELRGRAL